MSEICKERKPIIHIDMTNTYDATDAFMCTYCCAVMFSVDDADQHECPSRPNQKQLPKPPHPR